MTNPLRISILGCLVNGFGEAKEADLGIAAGSGKGIIFKRGVPIRHVKEDEMVAGAARGSRAVRRGDQTAGLVRGKGKAEAAEDGADGAGVRPWHDNFNDVLTSSLPQTNRDKLRFEIGVEAFAAQLAAHA